VNGRLAEREGEWPELRRETRTARLHRVELWVPDLPRSCTEWGWLLGELGYQQFQDWEHGRRSRLGGTYLVIAQPPA